MLIIYLFTLYFNLPRAARGCFCSAVGLAGVRSTSTTSTSQLFFTLSSSSSQTLVLQLGQIKTPSSTYHQPSPEIIFSLCHLIAITPGIHKLTLLLQILISGEPKHFLPSLR